MEKTVWLGAVADMVSGCKRLLYVKLLVMAAGPPPPREANTNANTYLYINRWGGLLKSDCFRMARSFSSNSVLTRSSEKKRGFSVF
jgi:hypothetical protein